MFQLLCRLGFDLHKEIYWNMNPRMLGLLKIFPSIDDIAMIIPKQAAIVISNPILPITR